MGSLLGKQAPGRTRHYLYIRRRPPHKCSRENLIPRGKKRSARAHRSIYPRRSLASSCPAASRRSRHHHHHDRHRRHLATYAHVVHRRKRNAGACCIEEVQQDEYKKHAHGRHTDFSLAIGRLFGHVLWAGSTEAPPVHPRAAVCPIPRGLYDTPQAPLFFFFP